MNKKIAIRMGASALLLGACAEAPNTNGDNFGYDGTGIQFQVAPLTLDSLSDACYSFMIENEAGQLVVGRGPGAASVWSAEVTGSAAQTICASRFGNSDGGDISYVAPCDASVGPTDDVAVPADGVNTHTVTLWVDALCASGTIDPDGIPNWDTATAPAPNDASSICTEIQPYQNPCGSAGCELQVACAENADTPVTFNFTIMGQADQGFFDIAVNFEDVFCSAKFDTCNTLGEPIRLVFDADGNRMDTAVAAVACTSGMGDNNTTHLTVTSARFECTGTNTVTGLPVSPGGELNLQLFTSEGVGTFPGNLPLANRIRYARYFGTEAQADWNKVYTNIAFGLEPGATCTFEWIVMPSNGPLPVPSASTTTFTSQPNVSFDVGPITAGACVQEPLNGGTGQVETVYSSSGINPSGIFAAGRLNAFIVEGGSLFNCFTDTGSACIL